MRQLPHQILVTEVTELRATLDVLDVLKACINKVICYLVQLIVHRRSRSSSRGLATKVFRNWARKINIL